MIERYIVELLYKHDCVMVADFGGFILNYQKATVDEERGIIKPPCKSLAFNSSLKNDDGLLCSYIASERNISYNEAKESIAVFVKELYNRLNLRENVYLSGLGNFSLDDNDNIVFDVQLGHNFYVDYMFFNNYSLPKVKIEDKPIEIKIDVKPLSRRVITKYAASIALILGLGVASYFGADYYIQNEYKAGFSLKQKVKQEVVENKDVDTKNVTAEVVVQEVVPEVVAVEDVAPVEVKSAEKEESVSVVNADAIKLETAIEVVDNESVNVLVETKPYLLEKTDEMRHYIVVASYTKNEYDAAERYVKRLIDKGFADATVLSSGGRNRVVVYSSSSFGDAERELENVKQNLSTSAWILYY